LPAVDRGHIDVATQMNARSAVLQVQEVTIAYRVPEACRLVGIGRTTLYALLKSGQIRAVKIAGRTLIPRTELERLIGKS
jgi:excisionase family DNA binding protein